MAINNSEVKRSDIIYDILNGRGNVATVDTNSIEVLFDNGRRMTFDATGHLNGVRRLFWHNPIMIDPPKSPEQWGYIQNLVVNVNKFINQIIKN